MIQRHRGFLLGAAAAGLLVGSLGVWPAAAQSVNSLPDGPVDCAAVARLPMGSWNVVRPVTIRPHGTAIGLAAGQSFAPNQFYDGVEVSEVLDRDCGNH